MFRIALTALVVWTLNLSAQAQGLIWSLPEDGAWVRFEGSYQQVEARPESTEGNLTIDWIQHLTLKSVGQEPADFRGETVPCRWIEIKVQTGKIKDGQVSTRGHGERLYKVLVPEKAVFGSTVDDKGLPVQHLPIVKGWRRISETDNAPKELKSGILQVYPVVGLLRHYKEMEESDIAESITVGMEDVQAKRLKGTLDLESETTRVHHESELYRSDSVPFGLARWTARIVQEEKSAVANRSDFQMVSEITIEMTARETGRDAKSELIIPGT